MEFAAEPRSVRASPEIGEERQPEHHITPQAGQQSVEFFVARVLAKEWVEPSPRPLSRSTHYPELPASHLLPQFSANGSLDPLHTS